MDNLILRKIFDRSRKYQYALVFILNRAQCAREEVLFRELFGLIISTQQAL